VKPKLVALLGTSPGTVHTTLCKLQEHGIDVDEVVIYATLTHTAAQAQWILWYCPCPKTGKPPLPPPRTPRILHLGFNDIHGPQELDQLRKALAQDLDHATILDVTGGRKAMAIAAALEAYRRGATVVATIIPQEEYNRIQQAKNPCEKTAKQAHLLTL